MAGEAWRGAIQIAGVRDQDEARLLVAAGIDFIGFPLRLLDGREDLDENLARELIGSLPRTVGAVAITYLDHARDVLDLCLAVGTSWVQLHGAIAPSELLRVRERAPGLGIIKSLIVRADNLPELLDEVARFSPHVDAFITDTFDPASGRSGATGRTHDWAVSRTVVAATHRPVILAGGLEPANVSDAIRQVRPAAVDVHTGVENAAGAKDPARVDAFVHCAREAFAALHM